MEWELELNDVLDLCATWSNCRFDDYLTYNHTFTRKLVSRLDSIHPSLEGQATLAALTWKPHGGFVAVARGQLCP